jgi:hypothetical protein
MLDETADTTGNRWITYQQFDENYNVTRIADPSAINLSASPVYDDTHADLAVALQDEHGLVTINTYYAGSSGSSSSSSASPSP